MKGILLVLFTGCCTISLTAQNPMLIAECDFDNVFNNCLFSFDTSDQNIWQAGTPQKPFFGNALSVPHAMMTDTVNPYPVNSHAAFTLKFANNIDNAIDWNRTGISFWHKYQTNALQDSGFIEYSIDNGLTWLSMTDTNSVQGTNGYPYSAFFWDSPLMQSPLPVLKENVMSGISTDWVFSSYQWFWFLSVETNRDNFTPDTILVRFNFDTDSDFDNYDGWIIDNIKVEKQWYSGMHEIQISAGDLQLYPNPAVNQVNFALSGREIPQVQQLINIHGEVVHEFFLHQSQGSIELNNIPAGNYLLKVITSAGHFAAQPLIVQ